MKKGKSATRWTIICILILVASFILAPGCASQTPAPTSSSTPTSTMSAEVSKIYEAAKKESTLMVVSGAFDETQIATLAKKFNEAFPGIKVEGFMLSGREVPVRIIAEAQAGKSTIDVGIGDYAGAFDPLMAKKLVDSYDWSKVFSWMVPGDDYRFDGRLVRAYTKMYLLGYNTKLVKASDAPKKYADLTDPKWSGNKIVIEQSGLGFHSYGLKYGEDAMMKYAQKIMDNKPLIKKGSDSVVAAVVSGEAQVGIGCSHDGLVANKTKGAPIEWNFPEAISFYEFGWYINNTTKNPNAAKLWVSFWARKENKPLIAQLIGGGVVQTGVQTNTAIDAFNAEKAGTELIKDPDMKLEISSLALRNKLTELITKVTAK